MQVPSQGTVIPRTESQLVVEVSGRVTEISPQLISGGFFNEGEMLLRIDPRDYELATAQADLNVAAANRRLAEEQADAEVARKEWERMGRGEPTALTLREPQVAEAKANLISAQAMLERARRDLERTTILAPYSGRVRSKSVDLGQFVNLGSPVATIYATDFAEVRLPLADEELAFVTLPFGSKSEDYKNQPDVELTAVFAGERRSWDGKVVRTEGEIDPNTRMVMVIAQVIEPYGPNQEVPLALGMFVEGSITGHRLEDVFVLPRTALRDGDRIYALDEDDRLHFVDVDVIRRERDMAIVRSEIGEGTRVVISPLEIATDGMQVRDLSNDADRTSKPAPVNRETQE